MGNASSGVCLWRNTALTTFSVYPISKQLSKTPIGLLCINLDVSKWEEFRHLLDQWSNTPSYQNQPEVLFKDDWREKINLYVSDYLNKEGLTLKMLNKEKKRDLIQALHRGANSPNCFFHQFRCLIVLTAFRFAR